MSERGTYTVKEIFGPTVQGEGAHAGRACVFLRFAACNLRCTWCDTDFSAEGASRLTAGQIVARLLEVDVHAARMVVVTGGEPTLQWDKPLAEAVGAAGFSIHMESNGTRPLRAPVDWLTVSPKPRFHGKRDLLLPRMPVSECKVVVDESVTGDALAHYESLYDCQSWFLQPCMDERYQEHLERAVGLALRRPRWRLSLQLHKIVGLP